MTTKAIGPGRVKPSAALSASVAVTSAPIATPSMTNAFMPKAPELRISGLRRAALPEYGRQTVPARQRNRRHFDGDRWPDIAAARARLGEHLEVVRELR